jgi:hypothetical protein
LRSFISHIFTLESSEQNSIIPFIMRIPRYMQCIIILFLILLSQDAIADVILPAFYFKQPSLIMLIIPVILIEYAIIKHCLNIQHSLKVLHVTAVSNVCSAIVGYPILVIISSVIGFFFEIFRSVFLHIQSNSYLLMSIFAFSVIVIAFLLSYIIEYAITARLLKKNPEFIAKNVKQTIWQANIASYVFLIAAAVILEMYGSRIGKSFLCLYYYKASS